MKKLFSPELKTKEKDPTYKFKKYIDQLSKVLRPPDKYKDPNSLQLDHLGAFFEYSLDSCNRNNF